MTSEKMPAFDPVEVAPSHVPPVLDSAQVRRYSRHLTLTEVGVQGQRALLAARVLVVGAGGLGSPVLAYLAAAGVGTLGIVDDDVVDISNLQRQIIHRNDSANVAKTTSAAQFVKSLNPEVKCIVHDFRLSERNALEILPNYDIVVDGTDNFATRYLVNDACVMLGLPFVWASILQFSGQLSVVNPGAGPCYRCLFPQPPDPASVPTCASGGVLGVLPGVMGTLQATEVVKLITGAGRPLTDAVLIYDALTTSFDRLALAADPQCPVCGEHPAITSLAASVTSCADASPDPASDGHDGVREVDLESVAGLAARDPLVVDVREEEEIALLPLDGAQVMPLSRWNSTTAQELIERAGTRDVLTVCASGVRSKDAALRLVAAGLPAARAVSFAGGMTVLTAAGKHSVEDLRE